MKRILFVLAFMACLISCRKPASISISPNTLDFTSSSGTAVINVEANYEWTATCPDSWVSLNALSSEKGSITITVSVSANSDPDARTSTVTFVCEDAIATLTITQAQKDMVVLDSENTSALGWEEQLLEVKLGYNTSYTVTTSEDWVKVVETKALKSGSVILSIEANETRATRTAEIRFYLDNGLVSGPKYKISQSPKPRNLDIDHVNSSFTVPTLRGTELSGTIDWGDGSSEVYAEGATHSYKASGNHRTDISVTGTNSVTMDNIIGVDFIDLSQL